MPVIKKGLFLLGFLFSFYLSDGQQTHLNPTSYWVFIPYIYNPAIVGSKDFLSIDLNAAFQGKSNTKIVSGNTRLSKTRSGYFSSPDITEFNNIGIGGSVFNDVNGSFQNIGVSAIGSYQIPISTRKLSFLSIGISAKGVYNILDTSSIEPRIPSRKTFYPNLDLGIYFFSTNFFTGLSTTNLLGNQENPDSLGIYAIPVSRQYFFTAGYKILLSRSLNIILEPSVLINAYYSTFLINSSEPVFKKISDNFNPIIKLYVDNFCIGSYFLRNEKTLFFIQYRYPTFYAGAFCELPKKSPYFKKTPIVEFTIGINIQIDKSRFSRYSHW